MLESMHTIDYIGVACLVLASFASGISFGAFIMHVLYRKKEYKRQADDAKSNQFIVSTKFSGDGPHPDPEGYNKRWSNWYFNWISK